MRGPIFVVPVQSLPRDYLPSLPCPRGCGDPSPLFPRKTCPATISPPLSPRMRGPIPVVPAQSLPRDYLPSLPCPRGCGDPSPLVPTQNLPRDYLPSLPCPRECGDPSPSFPRKTCPVIISPPSLSSRMRGPVPLPSPTPTGAATHLRPLVLADAGTHPTPPICHSKVPREFSLPYHANPSHLSPHRNDSRDALPLSPKVTLPHCPKSLPTATLPP